jgi:peptide/nickel transport system substrate-binding protein
MISRQLTILHAKSLVTVVLCRRLNGQFLGQARQLLTGHARYLTRLIPTAVAVAILSACAAPKSSSPTSKTGGAIVASLRSEPRTFNRHAVQDAGTELISVLTNAKLVRVNKATQQLEPWLADSWDFASDARHLTLRLHPNVVFSDGHPFTADDVLFSFEAAYNAKSGSVLVDALKVGGAMLSVAAPNPQTVAITFPEPYAPGPRMLDNLPIYPRHKLGPALAAGTFASAWGLSTPIADITGLGPFTIGAYAPGQRIVFDRNPHFFKKAADGTALPKLDRITVEIVADPNAEILRLDAGQLDALSSEVTAESYATVKRSADAGRVQLMDLGVGYNADALWFNLKPGAFAGDPRERWIQRDELRKAISLAVDRTVFADTVFLGAGVPVDGPETPANRQWYWEHPVTPHDAEAARKLLASIGASDARFTLLTQKGRPNLERGCAVIRDALKKIGVTVDVVALDGGAVIQRFLVTRDYDAIYFTLTKTDTDPAVNLDFWRSSGGGHVWNMDQPAPVTPWEAQIDALMTRQVAATDAAERKQLYDRVQQIFAEHLPMVSFVAPRIYAAASARLTGFMPGLNRPQLLWAPETLAIRSARP